MMWAPLLLAGFLSGWWGALTLAAAPPAIRDTPGETYTANIATRHYRPPSISLLDETVRKVVPGYHTREFPVYSWSETRSAHRDLDKIPSVEPSSVNQDPSKERGHSPENDARQTSRRSSTTHEEEPSEEDLGSRGIPLRDHVRAFHPKMDESALTRAPRHSSTQTPFAYPPTVATESARSRIARSVKQRPKNRTKADSPREQRRRCKNKDRCRGQNWCPDVDVGNRAYLAPTVFEGKARSMSSPRKPGSNYAVTFEVKQVYKSQPGFQPLQKNDSVRLHFRDKSAPGKSTACHEAGAGSKANKQQQQQQQHQQQRDNSSDVVRANIKRGKVYLVFVDRVGPRNFTILGEPVIRSKKNEQAVQAVVRPDYVREVTLSELRDSIARLRERVKLVCRTRGSPPPSVHWLKNGVPLHPRRGLRIQHKRRRSKLVISSAKAEDSGRYECVAESTSGHRASLAAQLLVTTESRNVETTTAAWPRREEPCPIPGDFCMNGGTCLFFETVGEPACRCADGFTGLRCETKDVISTGNMDKFSSFAEDVTLARF
ncbi:protein vein isoform X2 [Odontomachus brunneus]|uniref:protein vein isoform X2 n=1 Tax=Odontomachus brunneus TaxID=486640 RepID=UPI0013F21B1B|nr:protein vein isoform X2 [Odontomachus brunneus]